MISVAKQISNLEDHPFHPEEYPNNFRLSAGDHGALRRTILDHLPDGGIVEAMSYGMIGLRVHSVYPAGYHDPKLPLPFISIASQKNHIGLYHMGLYASPN